MAIVSADGRGAIASRSSGDSPPHNLPTPLTSLAGRAGEQQAIRETIRRISLVTLTGGRVAWQKTRLALELARTKVARRADGAWLVASGPDAPDVAAEVARCSMSALGAGTTATDTLRRYLASRDLLPVLETCKHLVGPAPSSRAPCWAGVGGVGGPVRASGTDRRG